MWGGCFLVGTDAHLGGVGWEELGEKKEDRWHPRANLYEHIDLWTAWTTWTLWPTGTLWMTGTLWTTGTVDSWLLHLHCRGRSYYCRRSCIRGRSYSTSQSHSHSHSYSRCRSDSRSPTSHHCKSSGSPSCSSPSSSSSSSSGRHPGWIVWWRVAWFGLSQPTGKVGSTKLADVAPPCTVCGQLCQILPWWQGYYLDSRFPVVTCDYPVAKVAARESIEPARCEIHWHIISIRWASTVLALGENALYQVG